MHNMLNYVAVVAAAVLVNSQTGAIPFIVDDLKFKWPKRISIL